MINTDYVKDVVDRLNEDLYNKKPELIEKYGWHFAYEYADEAFAITFIESLIWDSENDNRPYIEETDEYQDLYLFIKDILRKYVETINSIL
jgi:hypothetical protein